MNQGGSASGGSKRAGDKSQTETVTPSEWLASTGEWSRYAQSMLVELKADNPVSKNRARRDDRRVVHDMVRRTGGKSDAYQKWHTAHKNTEELKTQLAAALKNLKKVARELAREAAAGDVHENTAGRYLLSEAEVKKLQKKLESASIEDRALAQLALFGSFFCSKEMKERCEAKSDKDKHCWFVSTSTDKPWSPPDDTTSGDAGAAPEDEAVDVEETDANGESDEPSLSDKEAPAEIEDEPVEPEGATPSRETTEEPSAESKLEETVTPEGTTATQETKSVAEERKPPPPPRPSKKGEPAEERPEGSTHTFARPTVPPPPPPPPPIAPPVQPPGTLIQETVTIAFQQQPPPPPPLRQPTPASEREPRGPIGGMFELGPDVPPPFPRPGIQPADEPPPLPPGIYLDCQATPQQCKDAITKLNDALREIGITEAEYKNVGGRLVLVDTKTGVILDNEDDLLGKKNRALAILVWKVNNPETAIHMVIVNNKFRLPGDIEVTTTMAQPFDPDSWHPDAVLNFYFNVEAYSAYRGNDEASAFIKSEFGGKDPLNLNALLVNEIIEAEKVREFRRTGVVTDLIGNRVYEGNPRDKSARQEVHRGYSLGPGIWIQGIADRISEDAEWHFRDSAGLAQRGAQTTPAHRQGFYTWRDGTSEADGILYLAFDTERGQRHEYIIVHRGDGGVRGVIVGTNREVGAWFDRQRATRGFR